MEPLRLSIERDGKRTEMTLEGDTLLLGRGSDCDLCLDDAKASRHHCRLERLGGELFLVDLDSANGTWIENERIDRRPLAFGESFTVGSTHFHVVSGGPEALDATLLGQDGDGLQTLRTMLAVLRVFGGEDDFQHLAALTVDTAVSLTRAERGFLFLYAQGQTTLALGRNFAREEVPAPERKISATLLERALASARPLLLRDAASDGEFAGVQSVQELGLRSLLAAPLRHRGEVLGLLLVDHRLAGGALRSEDRELLGGLAGADADAVAAATERAENGRLRRKVSRLRRDLGRRVSLEEKPGTIQQRFPGIIGSSSCLEDVLHRSEQVMGSEVSVLIQGESGTGKELLARAVHFGSPRAGQPLVVENCGALPDTLLESELFGHVKGAFTGADRNKAGRFEEADGGTLFLDEVGEMSAAMQQRLLRVLQDGEVRRLGSEKVQRVDVRVIAATHCDLMEEVAAGRFREDLYYRLKVVLLEMPPLRERDQDIQLLAEHFLATEAENLQRPLRPLSPPALARLYAHPWPGNVRQLRNEIKRLLLLGEGEITEEDLSPELLEDGGQGSSGGTLPEQVEQLERSVIGAALRRYRGNRSRAAEALGLTRYTLARKAEKLGLLNSDGPDSGAAP